ncbi:hypothetical protein [Fuscibacter oryzae]|uniref:Uncharacterized protein n=1 Tax=Fuscibacter oryzae TaxID=2803939 RepID=A0A8J7MSG1_9RHOB|nr:hypothetical protein [Fuscibacter oryzae]MBL4928807.1 hypothetical protein [Fuscibacter oryzae]
MDFNAVLLELFSGLDGKLHIPMEVFDDMVHQYGSPIDINALATEAGCEVMVGRSVGQEQEEYLIISKREAV